MDENRLLKSAGIAGRFFYYETQPKITIFARLKIKVVRSEKISKKYSPLPLNFKPINLKTLNFTI